MVIVMPNRELNTQINISTRKATLFYSVLLFIVLVVLWLGAFSSAVEYIHFLVIDLKIDPTAFHLESIFLNFDYPAIVASDCLGAITTFHIPDIFLNDYELYFDCLTGNVFTIIEGTTYSFEPTKIMIITTIILFGQIPIFYIGLNLLLRKYMDLAAFDGIIRNKMQDNYLADKITQTIASNIHHELKTPLTALEALMIKNKSLVKSLMSIVEGSCNQCPVRKLSEEEVGHEYNSVIAGLTSNFEIMTDSVFNMFNTVNMIKTLKAIDTSTNTSVHHIITTSLSIFRMGSNYNFVSLIDPQLKNCYPSDLDPQSLANIIINHTKNSLEANAQVIKFELIGLVQHPAIPDDNILEFNIVDDGEGIPKAMVNKVYDLKESTKFNGTGVGLYICRALLNRVHGNEKILYTDKFGTIFNIKIPVKHCEGEE